MASVKLENFKKSFEDICRPNRFHFSIENDEEWLEDYTYLCKACSVPARTVGDITLNWHGMAYHVPGDPTYGDFTATFYNDNKLNIRSYFENWLNMIHEVESNKREIHSDLKATLVVTQVGNDGQSLREYRLYFAHPTTIGEIELDWDSENAVQTFTVTFVYSYFLTEVQSSAPDPNFQSPTQGNFV